MRFFWRVLLALGALQIGAVADAQIYTCTARDGTRIFSDEKCGPDAKIVPNITSKKPQPRTATPRPRVEPKTAAELEALLEQCNAGDLKACDTWTRGGGPNDLREKERAAERACETGSLVDCEYRYCSGSVSEECRARVLQAAKVAGDNWYLRDTGTPLPDGSTRYEVRCVVPNARAIADVVVTCSGSAGPDRCSAAGRSAAHGRLDLAAAAVCSAR
jgi:hypothetical protein